MAREPCKRSTPDGAMAPGSLAGGSWLQGADRRICRSLAAVGKRDSSARSVGSRRGVGVHYLLGFRWTGNPVVVKFAKYAGASGMLAKDRVSQLARGWQPVFGQGVAGEHCRISGIAVAYQPVGRRICIRGARWLPTGRPFSRCQTAGPGPEWSPNVCCGGRRSRSDQEPTVLVGRPEILHARNLASQVRQARHRRHAAGPPMCREASR